MRGWVGVFEVIRSKFLSHPNRWARWAAGLHFTRPPRCGELFVALPNCLAHDCPSVGARPREGSPNHEIDVPGCDLFARLNGWAPYGEIIGNATQALDKFRKDCQ